MAKKIKIKEIKSKIKIIENKDESLEDEVQEEFEESGESMRMHSSKNIDSGLQMVHRGGDEVEDIPAQPRTVQRQQPAGQTYQTAERGVQERMAYMQSSNQSGGSQLAPPTLRRHTIDEDIRRPLTGQQTSEGQNVLEDKNKYELEKDTQQERTKRKMPWEM